MNEALALAAPAFSETTCLRGALDLSHCLLGGVLSESTVQQALQKLGELCQADAACLLQNQAASERSAGQVRQVAAWFAGGCPSVACPPAYYAELPDWYERLSEGRCISGHTESFPRATQLYLKRHGVRSVLALPLHVDQDFWGFIRLDTYRNRQTWPDYLCQALPSVAAAFASVLDRLELRLNLARTEVRLRQAERQLQDRRLEVAHSDAERLRVVLETVGEGVTLSDEAGQFEIFNPAMEMISGYSRAEANQAGDFMRLLHPDSTTYEHALAGLREVYARRVHNSETTIRTRDGSLKHLLVATTMVQDRGHTWFLSTYRDISQLKRSQLELQQTNQKFITVLNSLECMLYVSDFDSYEVLFANTALRKRLYNPNLEGRVCWQVFHREQQGPCTFCRRNVLLDEQGQSTGMHTWEYQDVQGGRWLSVIEQAIPWHDGRMVHLSISRDITEYKQMEDSLNNQRKLLRSVIDCIPQNIFWKSTNGAYMGCNKTFATRMGFKTPRQVIGCTDFDLPWQRAEIDFCHAQERRVFDRLGPEYHAQLPLPKAGGEIDWLDISHIPLRNDAGRVLGVLGILEDVSVRLRTETELRRFKHALDMSPDGVLMADAETQRIVYANEGALQQLGYSRDELYQMSPLNIDPHLNPDKCERILRPLREGKRVSLHHEGYFRRKDNSLYPVEIVLQFLNFPGGSRAYAAIVHDLSKRRRDEQVLQNAKEDAEAANRAKSSFLANMSHELRTPLNAVLGYAQLFLRQAQLEQDHREWMEAILRNGEYLLTLVNDILDLSKIESGYLELEPSDFHLRSLLDEVARQFSMRATQKGICFQYSVLSHLPHSVHADQKRLRQILLNVLSNAVKFTRVGGVYFSVGYHHSKLRFQVEDTGPGIEPHELKQIFLPFHQAEAARYQTEGTGLGLSISNRLLNLMHSQLEVDSQPSLGSCFWFELELEAGSSPVQETRQNPRDVRGLTGGPYTLLVVDDHTESRTLLVKILISLGFDTREAADGEAAVEAVQAQRPDLVLMDLQMPKLNGFGAARRIRQLPACADLPIIAISASVFDQDQQDCRNAGCNALLAKPIHLDSLLEQLQRWLRLSWVETPTAAESAPPQSPLEGLVEDPALADWAGLPLAKTDAARLYELARWGDTLGLLQHLDQLGQAHPALSPLLDYLRGLAKNFKNKRIRQVLKPYR